MRNVLVTRKLSPSLHYSEPPLVSLEITVKTIDAPPDTLKQKTVLYFGFFFSAFRADHLTAIFKRNEILKAVSLIALSHSFFELQREVVTCKDVANRPPPRVYYVKLKTLAPRQIPS